jgi:hypothetical protein
MAKGKTTKLKEMKLMDGKAAPDVFESIKTIDDILGTKPQGPFKAKSLAEFEKQLDTEMNLADMQALAPRVGLIPIADRPLLRKRLIDEFKKNQARLRGINPDAVIPDTTVKESLGGKIAKTLREGS